MQVNECKGCRYLIWSVGIGQGIMCNHPINRSDAKRPPQISEVTSCTYYEPRKPQEGESPQ